MCFVNFICTYISLNMFFRKRKKPMKYNIVRNFIQLKERDEISKTNVRGAGGFTNRFLNVSVSWSISQSISQSVCYAKYEFLLGAIFSESESIQ